MSGPMIIFDWDGTLMDSVPRIVSCMQQTAREVDLTPPPVTAIHDVIGLSLPVALGELFNLHSQPDIARLIAVYRRYYVDLDGTPTPLFAGTRSLLEALTAEGIPLAVATGKARPGLERAWQQTDTGHFFCRSMCAKETASKPAPDMLHAILEQQRCAPATAVMVGDSALDMAMGRAAGVATVGVTWGVHDAERLYREQPAATVHDFAALETFLRGWLERVQSDFQ